MRSFLQGNPELRLALNEDLLIGKGRSNYSGSVVLDDCNFHECVALDEFEQGRTLHFIPPDGEFILLNYRITSDYRAPFRIYPTLEESGSHRLELLLLLRSDYPGTVHSQGLRIAIPVPRNTVGASIDMLTEIPGCTAEFNSAEKKVVWTVRKLGGGVDISIRVKMTLDQPVTAAHRREIGPISLTFEIPMYNVSGLQVRYLRISETPNNRAPSPFRWVRYVTQASSYIYRL